MTELWLSFNSDRFDSTSDLPPEANAGNRFYGRDVAEFIADGLRSRGYRSDFLDEDWGWLVRARTPSRTKLMISLYYDIDETAAGSWTLAVEERARPWRKRPPSEDSRLALESVFRDAGIALTPTGGSTGH